VIQATELINSILTIRLGFINKPIVFFLRLLVLGSTRSGELPTASLTDMSNATELVLAYSQYTPIPKSKLPTAALSQNLKNWALKSPHPAAFLKRVRLCAKRHDQNSGIEKRV